MSENALPCIVCKKALKNVDSEFSENQPYDGTAFSTPGHYGSTVFDPMDGTYVEINICDECVVEAGDAGLVLWNRRFTRVVLRTDDRWPIDVGRKWDPTPSERWTRDAEIVRSRDDEDETIEIDLEDVGTEIDGFEWVRHWRLIVENEKTRREEARD